MLEKTDASSLKPDLFSDFEIACFNESMFYLQHKTKLSFLSEILKSGQLLPRSQQEKPNTYMCGCPGYSFLMPYSDETKSGKKTVSTIETLSSSYSCIKGRQSGNLDCVTLMFDLRILQTYSSYHGNSDWITRGEITEKTKYPLPAVDVEFLKYVRRGEICFPEPIDLSQYLLEIWVAPTRKDELILSLKEAQVEEKWLNKIKEKAHHPSPRELIHSLSSTRDPKPETSSYSPLLFSKTATIPTDISNQETACCSIM